MDSHAPLNANMRQSSVPSQRRGSKSSDAILGGRSKPRASYACLNCRQRKIKCAIDPIRKKCNSCRVLQIPCLVSKDGDRRKLASREHISSLQDRLRHLESVIATSGQNIATPNTHPPDSQHIVAASPRAELRASSAGGRCSSPSVERYFWNPGAPFLNPNDGFDPSEAEQALSPLTRAGNKRDARIGLDTGAKAALTEEPLRSVGADNGLSNGLARAAEISPSPNDGNSPRLDVDEASSQSYFYGPSSQRYIYERQERTLSHDAEPSEANKDSSTEVNIDSVPVRNILLQIFWKSQPLSQAIIDQIAFETDKAALPARSQHYSDFLENAILACATRMSTSSDIRALGSVYANQASSEIPQELHRPNVATLQAFLLLSDFEATRGNDRIGYIYSGIGCRMVFDLGLQESCSDLVDRGKMSLAEAASRHILFLGAFVYDKLWSLYLGRPSCIPVLYLDNAQRRVAAQGFEVPETLKQWVSLAAELSQVADILNSDAPRDCNSLDALTELDARISKRCSALPTFLRLDESRICDLPATAYGLNIQFRGIRIVLHRLLSKTMLHNPDLAVPGREETIRSSQNIMRENAIAIARMVSVYQQICGIENVITVMLDNMYVAAALLVSHILRVQKQNQALEAAIPVDTDIRWLRCLADLLQKAHKHYPVTSRMLLTLSKLVSGTSLSEIFEAQKVNPRAAIQDVSPPAYREPIKYTPNCGLDDQSESLLQEPFDSAYGLTFQDESMSGMNNMMSWFLSPVDASVR